MTQTKTDWTPLRRRLARLLSGKTLIYQADDPRYEAVLIRQMLTASVRRRGSLLSGRHFEIRRVGEGVHITRVR